MKNVNLQRNRVTDSTLHHAAEETAFGKKSSVPVSSCQAMSNDDLEHTETLGRAFIFSMQTENRKLWQHTPETQFLLPTIKNVKTSTRAKIISGFLSSPLHKETSNAETVLPDLESWGQNRPGRSGQSSRCSHFSIMHLPAHAATRQKCLQHIMSMLPPPPAQQTALPQHKVAHVILLARTKAFQIGQGMNKQQLLQLTARWGASPLLIAALNPTSPWGVLPIVSALKDFPTNSGSYISHRGRQYQLYFPESCTSQASRYSSQTCSSKQRLQWHCTRLSRWR